MTTKEDSPVRITVTRAGEMQKLIGSGTLEPRELAWCECVVRNNPPGQRIYVESEMIERCEQQAEVEVMREIV